LIPHLEDQIQTLQNQVDSLQQKIIQLKENQKLNFKKALSELLKRSQASKIDQQYN
jgi:regulator of replication initiation timing